MDLFQPLGYMAIKEVLKKLEGLNCSICLDTYTDPKQLQCNHVYCQQCLVPLVVGDQQGQLGLTCPTCRQVTPIPDRGVAGLPPAFNISHLLEIQDSSQKLQDPAGTLEGAVGSSTVPDLKLLGDPIVAQFCSRHGGRELELYCETCDELICYKCAVKSGEHHAHVYEELDFAFEKYKEDITSLLEPMEKQVTTIKKALAQLNTRCGEISDQQAATKDSIHVAFQNLREVLYVRETELIGQLDQEIQSKLKSLAAQRDRIETTLAKVNRHVHFVKESLKADCRSHTLSVRGRTIKQAKMLAAAPLLPYILMTNVKINIQVAFSDDTTKMCENYGKLSIIIKVNPCDESLLKQKWCTVNQLYIKPERQLIQASQFSLCQHSSLVKTLVTPVVTIGGLDGPWGVAINQRGEVVVTELGAHCVSVFSPNGKKIRSFGTYGSGRGEFDDPHGVTVDDSGNILVADSGNHRVQKFTAEGEWFTTVRSGVSSLSYPSDVAFNNSKELYVVDSNSRCVQIPYSNSLLGKKRQKTSFSRPCGVACASTGEVYVTDRDQNSVVVFVDKVSSGTFSGYGTLDSPYYIAVDNRSNKVYVSEWGNHQVSVFTSKGEFVSSFGAEGSGPGEFNFPRGLAVDDNGLVYVCDGENDRVQVFKF